MTRSPPPPTQAAWSQIASLVDGVPGWTPLEQLYSLYLIATATSDLPGDIVEIGSWCGRSAGALGLAALGSGNARVHCIDLFPARDDWYRLENGAYSLRVTIDGCSVDAYKEQTVWREPFEETIRPLYEAHDSILEVFRTTIRHAGLEEVVRPFRGTGEQFLAAADAGLRVRMGFIDGDHGYAAVKRDIACLHSRLVPGGWLCLDDAFSSYDGVDRAIRELIIADPSFDFAQQLTRKLFAARKASARSSRGASASRPHRQVRP